MRRKLVQRLRSFRDGSNFQIPFEVLILSRLLAVLMFQLLQADRNDVMAPNPETRLGYFRLTRISKQVDEMVVGVGIAVASSDTTLCIRTMQKTEAVAMVID